MTKRIPVLIGGKWVRFKLESLRLVRDLPGGSAVVSIGRIIGYIRAKDVEELKTYLGAMRLIEWLEKKKKTPE